MNIEIHQQNEQIESEQNEQIDVQEHPQNPPDEYSLLRGIIATQFAVIVTLLIWLWGYVGQ